MPRTLWRLLPFLLVLPLCLGHAYAARHALVIGNDSYVHITPLKNARADARTIAKSLESAGFKVTLKTDLAEKPMTRAIREWSEQIAGGDEAVFFYAGHGVQIGGANYLLPIDLSGESEKQVKDDAIPLQKVLDDVQEQKAKFTLAIIDACRDNPFKGSGRNIGSRGLVPTTAANGQMIIFSAGSGQQALDRVGNADKSPNGLFTRVFVKEMEKPGIPAHEALRNVRSEVVRLAKSVNHEQVPAIYDQSMGDFYFKHGPKAAMAASTTAEDTTPTLAVPDAENELWAAVQNGNTVEDYETFLAQYPASRYAGEAKKRLAKRQQNAQAEAAQRDKAAWEKADKLASLDAYRAYLTDYPSGTYSGLAQARMKKLDAVKASAGASSNGKTFKDCGDCPEMINIQAGSFDMGGTASIEMPVHRVTIAAFALGKTEVTQAQWHAVMGSNPSHFKNCDDCPVEQVSWDDTQTYLGKLNAKTGKQYRLPSEAEWEYACRAGGSDEYCGGNYLDGVAWTYSNSGSKTHPVAQKQANAFGLYDMTGNVWEWGQDLWNDSYVDAPSTKPVSLSGEGGRRVLRGGSWLVSPMLARPAAARDWNSSVARGYYIGFRVAISLARALP